MPFLTDQLTRAMGRLWKKFRAPLQTLTMAAAMLAALGCWQGKISQAGEENGPEEAAVFVLAAQPTRIIVRHSLHSVDIVPVHTNARRTVLSMSDVDNCPDDGHRYANGLLAPLRT